MMYKITTTRGRRRRVRIWDARRPLSLDVRRQAILNTIEHQPQLQLRDQQNRIQTIPLHEEEVALSAGVTLRIQSLAPIPAIYLVRPQTANSASAQAIAYAGLGQAVQSTHLMGQTYVGYVRAKPLFSLAQDDDHFRIKILISGVSLDRGTEDPVPAEAGTEHSLRPDELVRITVGWGIHWWRFGLVDPAVGAIDASTLEAWAGTEPVFFRQLLGTGLISSLILAGLLLFQHQGPRSVPPPPTQAPLVQFVEAKKVPPPPPIPEPTLPPMPAPKPAVPVVPKEEPPKPINHPKAEPKPDPKPVPPKPAPPKEIVHAKPEPKLAPKAEGHKVTAHVAAPAPTVIHNPGPPPVKVSAPSAGATQLAALKSALGGARLLSHDTAGTLSDHATTPQGLFSAGETSSHKIALKTQYSGADVKISQLGGSSGGGGAGYGSAQSNIGSSSTRASFVSIDTSVGLSVDKGLLPEEVGAVIHAHLKEIRYCHEASMVYQPDVSGKLMVAFSISPSGVVESAKVQSSTVTDPRLAQCILTRLVTWPFPHPKGGIHVAITYPFIFKVLGRE